MPSLTSVSNFVRESGRDPEMLKSVVGTMRLRIRSENSAIGLRRDLATAHPAPEATIGLSIRPIEQRDVPFILETQREGLSAEEKWDRATRRRILEAGIGTCYVAVSADDEPTYMQWLFTHADDADVQRYFKGVFPVLDTTTALLEGAFTPAAHRGKRIMSAAMARIAELGTDHGAEHVITFVGEDNQASLKGCARAGFLPYIQRVQSWRLFRQDTVFAPLGE